MKILVKKSHLKIFGIILFVIVCIWGWAEVYKQHKEYQNSPMKLINSLTGESQEDIKRINEWGEKHNYTYSSDPAVEATIQAEVDDIVAEGIKQSEAEWEQKHQDKPHANQICEKRIMVRRTAIHQVYKAQYIVSTLEEVKKLRQQVINELSEWNKICDNTSNEALGANVESWEYYTDKITATANRQRLLEGRFGLKFDADKKEYTKFTMPQ